MNDLQDLIAKSTIRAYNQGIRDEHERFVKAIEEAADKIEAGMPERENNESAKQG
jgi:uncharacterized protein (DUF2164 family)